MFTKTYCGNHFITDACAVIMLNALNLQSAVYQLYANETENEFTERDLRLFILKPFLKQ